MTWTLFIIFPTFFFFFMLILLNSPHTHLWMHWLIHFFFRIINSSPVYRCIRRVSWLEKMNSFIPGFKHATRYLVYILFFFCFMEYDNLIMTLSRVCFLYVTDVLEGTSDIDWLKNMIGCLKQVPGKRKSIDCHKHFLALSLSLFSFYTMYMRIE